PRFQDLARRRPLRAELDALHAPFVIDEPELVARAFSLDDAPRERAGAPLLGAEALRRIGFEAAHGEAVRAGDEQLAAAAAVEVDRREPAHRTGQPQRLRRELRERRRRLRERERARERGAGERGPDHFAPSFFETKSVNDRLWRRKRSAMPSSETSHVSMRSTGAGGWNDASGRASSDQF